MALDDTEVATRWWLRSHGSGRLALQRAAGVPHIGSTEVGGRGAREALAARGTVLAREGGVDGTEQERVERLRSAVERNVRSSHEQPVFVRKLAKKRRELGFARWRHRAEVFGREIRSCERPSDVTRFVGRL